MQIVFFKEIKIHMSKHFEQDFLQIVRYFKDLRMNREKIILHLFTEWGKLLISDLTIRIRFTVLNFMRFYI